MVNTMIQAELNVKGIVQGVFFRARTKSIADSMNVKGYVKNLYDGSVKVVCECADEDLLRKFINKLNIKEDYGIYVKDIQVINKKYVQQPEFSKFYIKY